MKLWKKEREGEEVFKVVGKKSRTNDRNKEKKKTFMSDYNTNLINLVLYVTTLKLKNVHLKHFSEKLLSMPYCASR